MDRIDTLVPIFEAKVAPTVAGIPTARLYRAQFVATARLQLWFTAETHRLIATFAERMRGSVTSYANKEGTFDTLDGYRLQQRLIGLWGDTLTEWTKIFQGAREVAATLPFGGLSEFHARLISTTEITESTELFEARAPEGVFDPQIQILLNAAAEYLYGDGLTLSGRIWRMDRETRDGMTQAISLAISEGKSAWQLANELEQFLGADADCPRWTSTRLYGRTKAQIAGGDMTGLITNPNCDGQGVAYKALRLARNEIQKVHAMATDRVMQNSPWVEKEKINLSAQHPEKDICDEIVAGGEKGEGVYEKGSIELPLHVLCLCFKTAVLMDEKKFTSQLNAWIKGEGEWSAMDDYARFLGVETGEAATTDLSKDGSLIMLGIWLFGQELGV